METSTSTGAGTSSSAHVKTTIIQRRVSGMMIQLLDILRDGCNDPKLSARTMVVFLHVASRVDHPSVAELAELVGMSRAASSRLLTHLGGGTQARQGFGLVESYPDSTNPARKLVKLTPKGLDLIHRLEVRVKDSVRLVS